MTISYKWLSGYLPVVIEPERLSKILTSIGLEVEKMVAYEEVRGGLEGLLIGEVLHTEKHPNADKLTLTRVNVGNGDPLQIVCGAPNVASGQKVVVATVGTTIYPLSGDPLTMKAAKIRGTESQGMICAEDEIGIGTSHAGILVLPSHLKPGTRAADFFQPFTDTIYEIGLTPNRSDAMSHWGVARDVCAYLSHHERKEYKPVLPAGSFKVDKKTLPVEVRIENEKACSRYSGVCISGIEVKESPRWMQQQLKAIGVRPINNIVDITNFIQHETGQPLHAFDYDTISQHKIIVKNLPEGTTFKTLDEKDRKLSGEDLMICDAEGGLCIAGVYGGIHSGVTSQTKNVFLESAFFDPVTIRKTSFRHQLRTDAATRFEKGIDISNTVNVLKRASLLIKDLAGGQIASDVIDIYPEPEDKKQVSLSYQYLKKLSGKNYHPDSVKGILQSLEFGIRREGMDAIVVEVPFHKRDVSIPADIVEEVLRIDGLDNITIPAAITMTPSVEENYRQERLKTRINQLLTGMGCSEILTNSITNSAHFSETELQGAVRMLNNLSSELDILRPSMLPTALGVIGFNSNRKNNNLMLFEWGKTYHSVTAGTYEEINHLCLYVTGAVKNQSWNQKTKPADIYFVKGLSEALIKTLGIETCTLESVTDERAEQALSVRINRRKVGMLGKVLPSVASRFDIKQPVYFIDLDWDAIQTEAQKQKTQFREVPKFPSVERDLALLVPKSMPYQEIKESISRLRLNKLRDMQLFDVFESERLGTDKKSMAMNFVFLDEEKTLTDKEIDGWMQRIMASLEKELGAEIRK